MLKHIPFYGSLLNRQLTDKIKSTNSHVLVYGAIEAHSMGKKGCIASNETIAKDTGLKTGTVSKTISQLNAAGWLDVKLDNNNHRSRITPLLDLTPPLLTSKPPLTGQYTPPYSPVNIEYSKENTVRDFTNVKKPKLNFERSETSENPTDSQPPTEYGNPDINKLLKVFEDNYGSLPRKNIQRFAANRLIKKLGEETALELASYAVSIAGQPYAPVITNPSDLEYKLEKLKLYRESNLRGETLAL